MRQDNIFTALPLLRTLSASTLVACIKASARPSAPDTTPEVKIVLQAILALPSPAPTYRLELKRGLDVEEATAVLDILTGWAETWVANNAKGIEWDVSESTLIDAAAADTATLPSLEAVSLTHMF